MQARRRATAQTIIVALGDSLTKRSNLTRQVNWPQWQFQNLIGPYVRVVNAGKSGDTTQDMINRFATDVTPYRPKYVVVWGGINDNKFNPNVDDGGVAIETNLTSLYNLVRGIGAIPIGVTISPWSLGTWTSIRENVRQEVNLWLTNGTAGVTAVNLEPALADNTDPTHPILRVEYDVGDGVHVNEVGAPVVARQIFAQGFAGTPLPRP